MSEVFRSLDEARGRFGPSAVTLGNFDGVHLGHRHLVARAIAIARQHGWASGVVTFHPHPRRVVAPTQSTHLLTTLDERIALLEAAGVDRILVLPFTPAMALCTPEQFVEQVLVQTLQARAVVVGENYRFGHKQAGDCAALRALGEQFRFQTYSEPKVLYRGEVVSSSHVRRLIHRGDVSRAGRLLGRCYSLTGDVVKGHGIGSKQTVPTLNLSTAAEVLPGHGVYVTSVASLDDGRWWPSITNVGVRPTFEGESLTIESFLLAPLEGETPRRIRVEFRRWVRAEQKFEDAAALKTQIFRDVRRAQNYWRRARKWERRTIAAPVFLQD